jgi:hypothetical protein
MTDSEDQFDYNPTKLDLARLNEMIPGDTVNAECGFWRVLKYKNDYTLILNSKKHNIFKDFNSIQDILIFIKNL